MADIFFSYTKADRARIQPLIAALKEQNWTVWWDSNIYGGDSWSDVIEAELTKARCVIVAWSELSAKSAWVKEEARAASKAQKLVPVLLDSMDPPFGFGGIQAVDLSSWTNSKEAPEFLSLCAAIEGKLGSPPPGQSASGLSSRAAQQVQFPAQARRWLIPTIAAISISIALGVAGLLYFQSEKTSNVVRQPVSFVTGVQQALCVTADGIAGATTIAAVRDYLQGQGRKIPASIDLTSAELTPILQTAIDEIGSCAKAGFKNAFEVGYFGVPAAQSSARTKDFQQMLETALRRNSVAILDTLELTGKLDAQTRQHIAYFRTLSRTPGGDEVDFELVGALRKDILR
jgi:hypothetical protein